MLTESLVLSGLAAVVAAVVALGGVRLLKATAIGYVNPRFASTAGVLPRIDEISIDPTVLVFVVGLALAAGALFGLLPAIIGIYGVLSYLVSQRTKEIGIRMALGAQRTAVLKLVLGQGAVIIAIGIACGVATAMALTSYLEGMLFGLRALDLPTYTVVAGAFAIIAMLSVYLPARRATVVDPLDALRHE